MDIRLIVTGVFLGLGCALIIIGSIGVFRFPDFYTRVHPAGKTDTVGQALLLLGLMVHEGVSFISIKLLFIIIFIFIANPTATHFVAAAAYSSGLKPWRKK